jgi:hypothetical protein
MVEKDIRKCPSFLFWNGLNKVMMFLFNCIKDLISVMDSFNVYRYLVHNQAERLSENCLQFLK